MLLSARLVVLGLLGPPPHFCARIVVQLCVGKYVEELMEAVFGEISYSCRSYVCAFARVGKAAYVADSPHNIWDDKWYLA